VSKPPKYLHKYFSLFDDKRRSWLRECIQESTVYCSSPLDFNDPFESRFLIDATDDPEVVRAALEDPEFRETIRLPRSAPITPELVTRLMEHAKKQVGPYPETLRTKLLQEISVCCFSRSPTNSLLWAHYGDGHRGVCLRFQTDKDPEFFRHAHRVTYQAPFPRVSMISNASDREGTSVALTKASHWRYEGEWRVLMVDVPPGPQPVKPPALKAIIFGWRASEEDRATVSSWAYSRTPQPRLISVSGRPDSYGLRLIQESGAT